MLSVILAPTMMGNKGANCVHRKWSKTAKAKKVIQEVIASGDRLTAAIAQIKRGDLDKKKGDMKIALVDGYLRTVILYADVKEVQPEALYNTVKCFEQLQQSSYADKFRKRFDQHNKR